MAELKTIKIPLTQIVKVSLLKIDKKNPNVMTKSQLDSLKKGMKRFGFLTPIITNKDYLIADGEHRYKAAKALGMKEVPVIALPVNEVNRRILRQVLNKLRGEHGKDKDVDEFRFLMENDSLGLLADLMDAKENDFLTFIDDSKDVVPDEFDVNKHFKNPKYKFKLGAMWKLGKHRLMCGNSTFKDDVKALMGGKKPAMIHTDPPYGLGGYAGRSGKFKPVQGDDLDTRKFYECILDCQERYVWCEWKTYPLLVASMGLPRSLIVWNKKSFGMGGPYRRQHEFCAYWGKFKSTTETDVWDFSRATKYMHPTQKPTDLCARAIKNSSKHDDIVLDLFGGSGSTLIACEQTGRICYMMEIDPAYVSVIIERWEQFTGKKGVRL